MTNDLERVTQQMIAICKECNQTSISPLNSQGDYLTIEPEELLAFEQSVLAKRDDDLNRLNTIWIERYEQLQAKLAQQTEKLKLLALYVAANGDDWVKKEATETLNATQADVDNWMQGKKAEWEKGVLEEVVVLCKRTSDWISDCNVSLPEDASDHIADKVTTMIKERGGVR